MHNWHLLLLAFVAVFQPIASFTERSLVDGREQCSDHRTDLFHDTRFYGTRKLSRNRLNYLTENLDDGRYVKEAAVLTRPLSSRLVDHQERDVSRSFRTRTSPENWRSEYRKSELQYRDPSQKKEHIIHKFEIRQVISREERDHSRQVFRHTKSREARYDNQFSRRASTDQKFVRRDTQRASRVPVLTRREERQLRDNSENRRVTRKSEMRNMLMQERNDVTHSNDARRTKELSFDEVRQIKAKLVRETRSVRENYRIYPLERVMEIVNTRFDSRGTRDKRQRFNTREIHDVDRVERRGREQIVESRRNSQERFAPVRDESRERDRDTRSGSRFISRERLARESGVHNLRSEFRLISSIRQIRYIDEQNHGIRSESRFNFRDTPVLGSISGRDRYIREVRRNYLKNLAILDRSQTRERRDERSLERLLNQRVIREMRPQTRLNQYRDAEDRYSLREYVRQSEILLNSRETQTARKRLNARERFGKHRERDNTQPEDRLLECQSNEREAERDIQESDRARCFNGNLRAIRKKERDTRAAREGRSNQRIDNRNLEKDTRVETVQSETRREESREREVRNLDNMASARRKHKPFDKQRREIRFVARRRPIDPVRENDIRVTRNMERDSKYSRFLVANNRYSTLQSKNGLSDGEISLNWHYLVYLLQGLYFCGVLIQMRCSDNKHKARSFNMWPGVSSFKSIKVD